MPVHKWMLRHVYFPALSAGVPRMWAGTLVFAVSAVFHELLIGLPLHMVRCWAFVGVMSQARRRPRRRRACLRARACLLWWCFSRRFPLMNVRCSVSCACGAR